MTEPIRIPLSVHQQARFAAMRAEVKRIQDQQHESVATIVANTHDPESLKFWEIQLTEDEIVCLPPHRATPASVNAPPIITPEEKIAAVLDEVGVRRIAKKKR